MRRQVPAYLLLACVLVAGSGCDGGSRPEAVEAEVLAALTQFRTAVLQRDSMLLTRFYADDYVLTEDDGTVFSKPERLAVLLDSQFHFDSIGFTDVMIRPYGRAAVVTYLVTTKLRERPAETFRFQVTMVWVKQSFGWQVAASHESFLEVRRK